MVLEYYTCRLNTCEAVLNVILSVIFLRYYGMYGVVLGTAAEIMLIKLFVLPVYVCRSIRLPVRIYLFDTILVTLVKTALPLGLYFYLIKDLVLPEYRGSARASHVVQTLLFIPTAYFFIISKIERRLIRGYVVSFVEMTIPKSAEGIDAMPRIAP